MPTACAGLPIITWPGKYRLTITYDNTLIHLSQSLIRKCIYRQKYTACILKHCSNLTIMSDFAVLASSRDYCQPPTKAVDNGLQGYYDPTWIVNELYPGQCIGNSLGVPRPHYVSESKSGLSDESDKFSMYDNESSSGSM